jgi:2-keto-4-pentenoate hydratase/2-oxohepta-3-ene-1,7-dioic acid hydratase in catechol pathway
MRLLTFSLPQDAVPRVGVLRGPDVVLDVGEAARRANRTLPFYAGDLVSLIAAGPEALELVRGLKEAREAVHPLGEVRVLAPIPRPRKNVFCVGWNYLEHFEEGKTIRGGQELPEHPVFFSKAVTAVNGPYEPIALDAAVTTKLDWEVELGVVIGKAGKNIPEARALEHVFGYTVVNDVSARDLQRGHGGQWHKGKSLDGTCPMGPVIVTAEEIDATNLRVTTRVNGVAKQDSNTKHMYFKIPRLLAELSLGLTLEPGDVLSTGTPQGVGFARTPPEFLQPGDLLETEIEGIGVLRNRIQGEPGR